MSDNNRTTVGALAPTCGPRFNERKFDYATDSSHAVLYDCLGPAVDALNTFLDAIGPHDTCGADAEHMRDGLKQLRDRAWVKMTHHERDVRLERAR